MIERLSRQLGTCEIMHMGGAAGGKISKAREHQQGIGW